MAQQNQNDSPSSSKSLSGQKAAGNAAAGGSGSTSVKKNRLRPTLAAAAAAAAAAGNVNPIPSPKGKERAVDFESSSTSGVPRPLTKLERKKKRHSKRDHLDGQGEALGEGSQSAQRKSNVWDAIPVAQNEISSIPPVWSTDGRFYFTVTHTSIHIHSSTGPSFPRLSTLSSTISKGHTQPITSLHLSPLNPFQIVTSAQDGTIKIWDWVAGRLIRTIEFKDLDAKVDHVTFGEVAGKWWIFAAVTHRKDAAGHKLSHRVLRVPLSSSSGQFLVGKLSAPPAALMMSPRGTYLVALAATKAYTYRMPISPAQTTNDPWEERPTCVKFVSDQPFTCGSFCPEKILATTSEEEWFATGDQKGVIRLWHGLAQAFKQVDTAAQAMLGGSGDPNKALHPEVERRLPTTSLHWHAHAVSAIAFTPSGSQLLSVGEESVLVQWHLASGKREYIPRLGGRPIISLAVRKASHGAEEEWWMSLADGAVIRVGAASNQISNVGQGVRLDPLRPTSATTSYPIALHPATQSLVVPSSHPSTLQFIEPVASSVLFNLEVAPSNRVSRRDEKELEPVAVEKVAFSDSQNGKSVWMATIEGRKGDDMEGGGMVKNLKLWQWADEKYLVNTQFPRPHATSEVTSVLFSPLSSSDNDIASTSSTMPTPYLFTASADGVAKIWQVRQSKKSQQGKTASKKSATVELYWACRSTFEYRGMPIYDAAFSSDATIVALAHGSIITLWDVESNILLRALDTASGTDVRKIRFVGSEGRHLVGAGEQQGVVVWDLLSCEVSWGLPAQAANDLIASPSASFFVTSGSTRQESTITVFSPSSSSPLRVMSTTREVERITLLPHSSGVESSDSVHLVGVAPSGEIYRFGDAASSAAPLGAKSVSTSSGANKGLSIWQEMFGKEAFIDDLSTSASEDAITATSSALQQRIVSGKGRPSDVFDGPSHTMPPTALLFDAFMDELLSGHLASPNEREEEGEEDERVLYTEEIKLDMAPSAVNVPKARIVDDDEVKSLEVFFREVLTTAPASTPRLSGTKEPNGHLSLSNGTHAPVHTSAHPVSTPIGKKVNGHGSHTKSRTVSGATPRDVDMDGDDVEPDTLGGGSGKKGVGKKRKATRED